MRYSTGKILCLILRSFVLLHLVLLKHAFIPLFSCLFRETRSDFLRPENRTIGYCRPNFIVHRKKDDSQYELPSISQLFSRELYNR